MKSKLTHRNRLTFTESKPPVDEINALLETSRRVLVVSHIHPDGDALGSQLAFAAYLEHLGKDVVLVRDDEIPAKYEWLDGIDKILRYDDCKENIAFDTAVILECPNVQRVGQVARFFDDRTAIITIDHHPDNDSFGDVNWTNDTASSVGEMLFEYFTEVGFAINASVAEQLFTAILTDTGQFRYGSTSRRTMEIAGQLIEAGAKTQKICDMVYFNLQPSRMMLTGKVLNSIEFHNQQQICLLTLTQKMLAESEANDADSDGLVDYTLYNVGVQVGALLKEIGPESTKVSLRSRNGINVSEIAARFGGGGHYNASGCTIPMALEQARKELIEILTEAIEANR